MVRIITVILMIAMLVNGAAAQTETPTPVLSISTSPYIFVTTVSGQTTRFDYIATAGDVYIANLIALLFFSIWAMFFFGLFVLWKYRKGKQP